MQEVGLQNLRLLGQNGNNFEDYPGVRDSTENNETAYWVIQYANVMPIVTSSVDDFQIKFNAEFSDCTDFSNLPYTIQEGQPLSKITYGGESVVIDLFYPINVTLGEETKRYENFNTELNVRYRRMLERGREVIEAHFIQYFDYREPLEFVDERDFEITYEELDENNLVFTVTDPISYERNQFELIFATNLNKSDLTRTVSMHPDDRQGIMPYFVHSPDRLTSVFIPSNAVVRTEAGTVGEITVNQVYPNELETTVVTGLTYKIDKGEIKPGTVNESIKQWNLTYPVYTFGPTGTRFYVGSTPTQAPMSFFLDTDKFPFVGPLGILYRGDLSNGIWRPVPSAPDYNNSLITTNTNGFSDYTPIDCNYQQCSEVYVTSEQVGDDGFMCALSSFLEQIMIIAIISLVIIAILCLGSCLPVFFASLKAIFVSGSTATFAGVTYLGIIAIASGVGMVAVDMMIDEGYEHDETSISFIPTCNQIIEISCSGDASGGYCQVGSKKVQQGGSEKITLEGGQPYKFAAISEACDDCGDDCSTTGRLVYK